jgi:hypothetical protein
MESFSLVFMDFQPAPSALWQLYNDNRHKYNKPADKPELAVI